MTDTDLRNEIKDIFDSCSSSNCKHNYEPVRNKLLALIHEKEKKLFSLAFKFYDVLLMMGEVDRNSFMIPGYELHCCQEMKEFKELKKEMGYDQASR